MTMRLPIPCLALSFFFVVALPLAAAAGSDEDPRLAPRGASPAEGRPRAALPTGGPGIQPVYFTPQDNEANATVLFLLNTNAVEANVQIQGFDAAGTMNFDQSVMVPALGSLRLVSDSLAASPPPSWSTAQLVNFTDFVVSAAALLPTGVKIDGYVEWNPGTGTVDPRLDTARLPIRFGVGADAP